MRLERHRKGYGRVAAAMAIMVVSGASRATGSSLQNVFGGEKKQAGQACELKPGGRAARVLVPTSPVAAGL